MTSSFMDFPNQHIFICGHGHNQRRCIFTNSKGLPGVGLPRVEWNEIRSMQSGTVTRTVTDTTLPTGPIERQIIYQAPFTKSDRESDYTTVWGKLEAHLIA